MIDYILDPANNPLPVTYEQATKWRATTGRDRRVVAYSETAEGVVSTIFLDTDHDLNAAATMAHLPDGVEYVPLVWETAVQLDGKAWQVIRRYRTITEARLGHAEVVGLVKVGDIR